MIGDFFVIVVLFKCVVVEFVGNCECDVGQVYVFVGYVFW